MAREKIIFSCHCFKIPPVRGHPGQGEAVESVRVPRVLFKKGSTQLFTAEIVKGGLVAILILDEDDDDYVIMVPKASPA